MDYEKIGDFLRDLRIGRKLTQQELAEKLYISREAISKWERGISLPDYPSLIALSKFYNLTINEILAGEKMDEHNKDRINAVALTILNSSKKEIRKSKIINLVILLVSIIILLLIYFIDNYNSIHMYMIDGENKEYEISNGALLVSDDEALLTIGGIRNANGSILNECENTEIEIYYNKDNKRTLIKSNSTDNLFIRLYSYSEMLKNISQKDMLNNLYIDIKTDNDVSTIKINKTLFYENDYTKYISSKSDDYYIKGPLTINRLNNNNFIEIAGKNYYYQFNGKKINLKSEDGLIIDYIIDENKVTIYDEDDKTYIYLYDIDTCITSNCDNYVKLIKKLKEYLHNDLGLN